MDLGCRMDASSDDGCDGLSVDELRQLFVKQRNADDAFFADLGMSVSRITVIFYEMWNSEIFCFEIFTMLLSVCLFVCRMMLQKRLSRKPQNVHN